ncbi:MAG: type II toxin-antitoxin system ParD family antitoxin [Ferruginibacter sp.]|nr:type II toxin-antitoxin system ParD family antitoxin [Ferruginibacter sp.]
MRKSTSVSLGVHFESFVEESIITGRYMDAGEVIRAGLRLLEIEENRILALKNAIQEGVDSAIDVDFDSVKHLQNLKSRRVTNG